MPTYVTANDVKQRLLGKVRFTDDDTDENAVASGLLNDLIDEAEADVESVLSVRYEIPLCRESDQGAFTLLPQTTKNTILSLMRVAAAKRVLHTDFGRGTAVDGDKYIEFLGADYEKRINRLIERREDCFNIFKYPPLPDLRLAAGNSEGDDGYAGSVMVTSDDYGAYASPQMESPGETIWNGKLKRI